LLPFARSSLTRRQFLSLAAVTAGSLALAGCQLGVQQSVTAPPVLTPAATPAPSATAISAAQLDRLVLKGTPGPLTIPLARAAQAAALQALVKEISFSTWKTPDELRADVTSGKIHVATGTSNIAANLYTRGLPVRLLVVTMVQGMFSLMTLDPSINSWGDLKGRPLALAYKGDLPDLIFRYLAKANGLSPDADLKMQYTATPAETMQMLLAKRVEVAMVAEPQSTAAETRAQQSGLTVRRFIDLTDEWGKVAGTSRLPMGATIVVSSLAENHKALVSALEDALLEATAWTGQNPVEAAKLGAEKLGLEAPVLEKSLAHLKLEAVKALDARRELESFFTRLKELNPDVIGGDLPNEGFYYQEG